jgi:hypothetical protein
MIFRNSLKVKKVRRSIIDMCIYEKYKDAGFTYLKVSGVLCDCVVQLSVTE